MKDVKFSFCQVCRVNHTAGRGHVYTSKHKASVNKVLRKMKAKVSDVKFFVDNVRKFKLHEKQSPFWCDFCRMDIEEAHSKFVSEATVKHLMSSEHRKNVNDFFVSNVLNEERSIYFFPKELFAEWAFKCNAAEFNEDSVQEVESIQNEHPTEVSAETLPSPEYKGVSNGEVQGSMTANVIPPWLNEKEFGESFIDAKSQLFPSNQRKKQKISNPNRVGAAWAEKRKLEMQLEQSTSQDTLKVSEDLWLPNFGRVWQSGPRGDTRKEFIKETKRSPSSRRSETVEKLSEDVIYVPYVSKRKLQE